MNEFTVGPFRFEILDPYPVWINIFYEGKRFSVRHDELKFFEFGLQRAINQTALKLGNDAREVE